MPQGTYATVPVPGMRAMLRRLADQEAPIREETLDLAAPLILGESSALAPIRTGFLAHDSAFDDKQPDGSHVIGHGADYALAVHETHPTRSRFLVNAFVKHGRRILDGALDTVLARRIR